MLCFGICLWLIKISVNLRLGNFWQAFGKRVLFFLTTDIKGDERSVILLLLGTLCACLNNVQSWLFLTNPIYLNGLALAGSIKVFLFLYIYDVKISKNSPVSQSKAYILSIVSVVYVCIYIH